MRTQLSKKIIILFTILMLVLSVSACKKEDKIKKFAINYSVDYLNQRYGYDIDNNYSLQIYKQNSNQRYPMLCHLCENDEIILSYYLNINKDGEFGQINTKIDGKYYGINDYWYLKWGYVTGVNPAGCDNLTDSISINELLYLEQVENVVIEEQKPTDLQLRYNALKRSAIFNNYQCNDGDEISVYEHIPVLNLEYQQNDHSIMAVNREYMEFPVMVNGVFTGIIGINFNNLINSYYINLNTSETEDVQYILLNNKQPYIKVDGIILTADLSNKPDCPVIFVKAYDDLLEYCKQQSFPELLFTFTYNSNENGE